jgi:hypothetical protein
MDLESISDRMESDINDRVGERITYIPTGGGPIYPKAHVNYRDGETDLGAGNAIEQDITIAVRKASIPTMPKSTDRIRLGRRPGVTFKPVNPSTDDSGFDWVFNVKVVR